MLGASYTQVDTALREKIKTTGKSLGGKKGGTLGRKELLHLLCRVVDENCVTVERTQEAAIVYESCNLRVT